MISVIIPTLQKNKEFLINLISTVAKEEIVGEIILIDNSCKGLDYQNEKLKVIVPNENLFVNPSWNLGTREAKYDIVALLNDDITISSDFCSQVVSQMTSDMGTIGFDYNWVELSDKIEPQPKSTKIHLEKINGRCGNFGIAMFFYKENYVEIPDELKIYCGDDWIVYQDKKRKKQNYSIQGQKIYHFGSLSCVSEKSFNPIGDRDRKLYRRLTRKWWQFIFNYEKVFNGFRLTIFGIEILCHGGKKH